jgi:hypothetical protein
LLSAWAGIDALLGPRALSSPPACRKARPQCTRACQRESPASRKGPHRPLPAAPSRQTSRRVRHVVSREGRATTQPENTGRPYGYEIAIFGRGPPLSRFVVRAARKAT